MRKLICISMAFLFPIMVISGFIELHVHPDRPAVFHMVTALFFVMVTLAHLAINRKALIKNISGDLQKSS